MVLVEVRSPTFNEETGQYTWHTLALVRADGGDLQVSGNDSGVIDFGMSVIDVAHGTGSKLVASDNPELWARNLAFAFRAGDIVAETMMDSEPGASVRDEPAVEYDMPAIPEPACGSRDVAPA